MPLLLIIAIALLTTLGLVRVIVDIKVGSPFRYRPKAPPVPEPPPPLVLDRLWIIFLGFFSF